jgi:hypothetical protein
MVVENGKAAGLSARTLARLVAGLGAVERTGVDGGPLFTADTEHAMASLRVHEAPGVRIVSTSLSAKARVHDTYGVFAFTAPDSVIPHFTLDCSDRADGHAFHLDQLPRVELATAVAYMDEAFEPLSPLFAAAGDIEGLTKTSNSRRQYAMMSPWMLVHLATPEAFVAIEPTVQAYVDHWLELVAKGLSAEAVASVAATGTDVAARDALVRHNLFSPAVDPVWGRVETMLGTDNARTMQALIVGDA